MNRIFKTIFSKAHGTYVVADEYASAHGKTKSVKTAVAVALLAMGGLMSDGVFAKDYTVSLTDKTVTFAEAYKQDAAFASNKKEDSSNNWAKSGSKIYTTTSGNTLTVNVNGNNQQNSPNFYEINGAWSKDYGTLGDGTVLNINLGTTTADTTLSASIFGARNDGNGKGTAENNGSASGSVTRIRGNAGDNLYLGILIGGRAAGRVSGDSKYEGLANNNTIEISGAFTLTGVKYGNNLWNGIYAGEGYSASGNSIIISGTTITLDNDVSRGVVIVGGRALQNKSENQDRSGAAKDNLIIIKDGAAVNTALMAGYADGDVSGNKVYIDNTDTVSGYEKSTGISTVTGNVYGGFTYEKYGTAKDTPGGHTKDNQVISHGIINGNVYGGFSENGYVAENTVEISGEKAKVIGNVYGGYSGTQASENNQVTISDKAQVTGDVFAGYSNADDASDKIVNGNELTLSNATISGIVAASMGKSGFINSGAINAVGINSVKSFGGYNKLNLTVGAENLKTDKQAGDYVIKVTDGVTELHDTLTIKTAGGSKDGVKEVLLLGSAGGTYTIKDGFTVKQESTFARTSWTVHVNGEKAEDQYKDKVTVSDSQNTTAFNKPAESKSAESEATPRLLKAKAADSEAVIEGVTSLSIKDGELNPDKKGGDEDDPSGPDDDKKPSDDTDITKKTEATENTKTLTENRLATVAMINQGAEFIADEAMNAFGVALIDNLGKPVTFGTVHAGQSKYQTGSHIDVDSVQLATGVGLKTGDVRHAYFIEAGWASSKSHVHHASGSGEHEYYGLGAMARWQPENQQYYVDGSLHAGVAKTGFDGRYDGDKAHYTTDNLYVAGHLGTGYIFKLKEGLDMDVYGRYTVSWLDSDSVRLHDKADSKLHLSSITTHALRGGVKFLGDISKTERWYAGVAYEHIFNGKDEARLDDMVLDTPTLKGNTGIGEVGYSYKPSEASPWKFDLGAKGYIGDRKGYSANATFTYSF